jgi:tetratricopeptide (TPR) repeat protein
MTIRSRSLNTAAVCGCLASVWLAAASAAGQIPSAPSRDDFSNESFIVESLTKDVTFAADGTGREESHVRLRLQSDAAVANFGIVRFAYRADRERLEILDVSVHGPNGSVVTTPLSDVQDLADDVSRGAPMYTDGRQMHVPVRGLRVGTTLEWRIRLTRIKADAPGTFWYVHDFDRAEIVQDETLTLSVPAAKYVQVSSPQLAPTVVERSGVKTYNWKTSHLTHDADGHPSNAPKPPAVQITTFRSWQEVGQWYHDLERPQLRVTPEIRRKAEDLTAGLSTDAEKRRAIYQFVAPNFRYISLSLGQGRYQPHSASEVLGNAYGDCKDKHTLFVALLKAAEIPAAAALVGVGTAFDESVPSPALFNHVVTYLPDATQATWADTTAELAPYGLLVPPVRGRRALVIPDNAPAFLSSTPDTLPFSADQQVTVTATLTADGTLSGRTEVTMRGDVELIVRAAFRGTPKGRWGTMLASLTNDAQTVTEVETGDVLETDTAFHYRYSFEQKAFKPDAPTFFVPVPAMTFPYPGDQAPPSEPLELGAPGALVYQAHVTLPNGFSAEIPTDVSVHASFADYTTSYTVKNGAFDALRRAVTKQARLPPANWTEYQQFVDKVVKDHQQYVRLVRRTTSAALPSRTNREAVDMIVKAMNLLQAQDLDGARVLLSDAEHLNPTEVTLWLAYATLYGLQSEMDRAIDALKREIRYHPSDPPAYEGLADIHIGRGDYDAAIATLRQLLDIDPAQESAARQTVRLLIEQKEYSDAIAVAQAAINAGATSAALHVVLGQALIRAGNRSEGIPEVIEGATAPNADDRARNEAAYVLAEQNAELPRASEWVSTAVRNIESAAASTQLASLREDDFNRVRLLLAAWDTQGWIAFRRGDLKTAEKFADAAWRWSQHPEIGFHLGQIYEAEGNRAEAIRVYQRVASEEDSAEVQARLTALRAPKTASGGDLAQMRTTKIVNTTGKSGLADFFVLFSVKGVEDARFFSGAEALRPLTAAIVKAPFEFPIPDQGPERLARRGIMSCTAVPSECFLIMLLPADASMKP